MVAVLTPAAAELPKASSPVSSNVVARSEFSIVGVADRDRSIALYSLKNRLFVGDGVTLAEAQGDELVDVSESVLASARALQVRFRGLVGSWPDAAWAMVDQPTDFGHATSGLVVHRRGIWTRERVLAGESLQSVGVGVGGSVIGLGYPGALPQRLSFLVSGGRAKEAPDIFIDGRRLTDEDWLADSQVLLGDDGRIFLLASTGGRRIIGHTSPSSQKRLNLGTFQCADTTDPVEPTGILRGADGRIHAFGRRSPKERPPAGIWSTFDGSVWRCGDVAGVSSVLSLAVGRDGAAAMIAQDADRVGVWRRLPSGTWLELAMPTAPSAFAGETLAPSRIAMDDNGGIWIVGSFQSGTVVLHNRPAQNVLNFPQTTPGQRELLSYQPPRPATKDCAHYFAVFYPLSKLEPPDHDAPLMLEVLRGHSEFAEARFVEFQSLGQRYVGAVVPEISQGRKLVELVKRGVKGSAPILLCQDPPHVTRDVRFDLLTGSAPR